MNVFVLHTIQYVRQ